MSAQDIVLTANRAEALNQSLVEAQPRRQVVFWAALWCAAAVHAALVLGIARAPPRYLGDPSGSVNAIDVELIDAAELSRRAAAPAPAATPPPAAEPAPEALAPETAPAAKAAPADKRAAVLPLDEVEPKAPLPQSQPERASPAAKPQAAPPKADKKSKSEPKPTPERLKPPERLDLSVPLSVTMQGASDSGSTATRPPGITRSGENDRFGRDVIRALRKTMPPQRESKGRVTIRIFLNERGNIAKVQLVQSGGDPALDQDVIFSARQASFPFPPKGATLADRTFLVTYIYR